MNLKNETKELHRFAKAAASIGFIMWSVFPMYLLGWLASAIGRHPIAESQITSEPVYKFLLWWQGGVNAFPVVTLLIISVTALITLSYVLVKHGYSHRVNAVEKGGFFLRKILIPAFLSFSAFAGGILSGGSFAESRPGVTALLLFSLFALFVHYVADTIESD